MTVPRLKSVAGVRIPNRRHDPAAQVLTWTDDIARTAGCTLHSQPIPTASQIMATAPYVE
jgi:hypothetical protein